MITERDIAEKFSIIWREHFPLLTPNFMRVFNEAQTKEINAEAIPIGEDVRTDLVSELAFNIAGEIFETDLSPVDYLQNMDLVKTLVFKTAEQIWKTVGFSKADLQLKETEITDCILITSNILEFIKKLRKEEVIYKPILKGYGVISDLTADVSIDDTLYEFKTVSRNFRSSDLKQLFIYLALQQVTGNMKWKYAGLYNPRRGTYCKFNIKGIIYSLSGGKSTNEVFENLLKSLTRDIIIDSKF